MCNGKRFAVVFNVAGRRRVMSGIGEYDVDRDLGPVLRVTLQDDEDSDNDRRPMTGAPVVSILDCLGSANMALAEVALFRTLARRISLQAVTLYPDARDSFRR